MTDLIRSGSRKAGATIYCKRIFQHPFDGFEIVLVVTYR
jgi:hypothetical protein